MMPAEIFLSHAAADHLFATRFVEDLRRHGLPVWFSPTNIMGASQWHDEIGAALARCDWFVILLSPRAVESMWVKRELIYAESQRRLEGRILPALMEPCAFENLSWVLPNIQYIDFQNDYGAGMSQLFRVWGLGYRPSGA